MVKWKADVAGTRKVALRNQISSRCERRNRQLAVRLMAGAAVAPHQYPLQILVSCYLNKLQRKRENAPRTPEMLSRVQSHIQRCRAPQPLPEQRLTAGFLLERALPQKSLRPGGGLGRGLV